MRVENHSKEGNLYIVGTPIGNLEDITLRALHALKSVDLILAEDTRVTKKLLHRYDIKTPVQSYHEHSGPRAYETARKALEEGKSVALVTDAGTPAISDPGAKLVQFVVRHSSSVIVVPIPGPSALIAALSVSGLNADRFTFLGYPPHKKGRETFFKKMARIETRPIVLYESPHRLAKTLGNLEDVLGADVEIIITKELTKIHEEIWRGLVTRARACFTGEKGRGEFVLIIP